LAELARPCAARPFDIALPKREIRWQQVADRAAFLAAALSKRSSAQR